MPSRGRSDWKSRPYESRKILSCRRPCRRVRSNGAIARAASDGRKRSSSWVHAVANLPRSRRITGRGLFTWRALRPGCARAVTARATLERDRFERAARRYSARDFIDQPTGATGALPSDHSRSKMSGARRSSKNQRPDRPDGRGRGNHTVGKATKTRKPGKVAWPLRICTAAPDVRQSRRHLASRAHPARNADALHRALPASPLIAATVSTIRQQR